jgi:hypothetical protein
MSEELAKYVTNSPASMMLAAIDKGADLDKLEKLMQLQERWEINEARKAYHKAMSQFKANPPKIGKDKHVKFNTSKGTTEYYHASLANVTDTIGSELSKYGLSAAWKTVQTEGKISVTCTITHELGHSESTSLTAAPDESGSKNPIQAIGSTAAYLERYTLLALTGLATHDMDDDGGKGGDGEPSKFEQWEIKAKEVCEAARTVDDIIQWWPDQGPAIKKELNKADAAKIWVDRKNELKKAEPRDPGQEG